jgi:hypothetical protein
LPTQDTDVLKVKSDGLIVGAASAQENAVTLSGATGEFGSFVSIGPVGRGSLTLRNGAQTTSRTMDLGFSAGGEATLLLDGTLLPVVAKVEDELLVAQDGHTRVELTGNAELEAKSCTVGGGLSTGLGEVILTGEVGVPLLSVSGTLHAGKETNGLIAVLSAAGGVSCESLLLGGLNFGAGGTLNLANFAICNTINGGAVGGTPGPGLLRIAAGASFNTPEEGEKKLLILPTGLVLVERGANINAGNVTFLGEGGRLRTVGRRG